MPRLEKIYYVDLPADTVERCWRAFQESLSYPGAGLEVRFEAVPADGPRCKVLVEAGGRGGAAADDAMRDFRIFLDSRGLAELTPTGGRA